MINEIRVAFAHRFGDVIADNCLSLPKLEACFGWCFYNNGLLKVMKVSFFFFLQPGWKEAVVKEDSDEQ